jgi:hypothetical protein
LIKRVKLKKTINMPLSPQPTLPFLSPISVRFIKIIKSEKPPKEPIYIYIYYSVY